MLFILQSILTIVAWFRGWKWYSLLPLGIGLFIGFSIGFFCGVFGIDYQSQTIISISGVIDYLIMLALIIMIIVKRKTNEDSSSSA